MYKERTKRVFEHTTVKNVFTMKTVKSQFKHNDDSVAFLSFNKYFLLILLIHKEELEFFSGMSLVIYYENFTKFKLVLFYVL